jgi:uncharacterized protein (DUF2267 family)
MKYRELIQRVEHYSGFSRDESKDALQVMVESLAVHLPEADRKDFAHHLPSELKRIALSVLATKKNSQEDILYQFMYLQNIDEGKARRQIKAAWAAIKDAITGARAENIRLRLPKKGLPLLR